MKDLEKGKRIPPPTCVIACEVFKPILDYLQLEDKYPHLRVNFLPSRLHLYPQKLKNQLLKESTASQKRGERVICLYGDCFPDIDGFCKQHGIIKVPGFHCYEMLLGNKRFQKVMEETAGTFFVQRDLILNFEENCMEPLELYDEEMREYCFKHYQRLLYVRQPSDVDLVPRVVELAKLLGLSLEITDADYSHLEKRLIKLLRLGLSESSELLDEPSRGPDSSGSSSEDEKAPESKS